jgi:ectoine hydroxylase-related dioxygenase (phytanoyl-CoA dioxygenase family)
MASEIVSNIPLYDIQALGDALAQPSQRRALLAEWAHGLMHGSGVVALRGAYADTAPIDRATEIYEAIIAREKGRSGADHFAGSGANDRVWNSLQKLCLEEPETFALYFGNPAVAAVSEAWLGPGYQMTAQVNLVRPGGKAQEPHRDYHLGFMTEERARAYPAHVHDLSPVLTLQGAIAHCDMPVESGPTKLLPFSQQYRAGYLAYRHQAFKDHFEANFVQLPLKKGDAVFFNPALFHAAGDNVTENIARMANLLQVSSPMGIPLEQIDRTAMCLALYPALRGLKGRMSAAEMEATVAAAADGYSFPTNLDTDPPEGGLAPKTQNALMHEALKAGWSDSQFAEALRAQEMRRQA